MGGQEEDKIQSITGHLKISSSLDELEYLGFGDSNTPKKLAKVDAYQV